MNIVEDVKLLSSGDYIPKRVVEDGDEELYRRIIKALGELKNDKIDKNYNNSKSHMIIFEDIMYSYLEVGRAEFIEEQLNNNPESRIYPEEDFEKYMTELNEMWDEEIGYSHIYIEQDIIEILYTGELCCIMKYYDYDNAVRILNSPQVSVIQEESEAESIFVEEEEYWNAGVYF